MSANYGTIENLRARGFRTGVAIKMSKPGHHGFVAKFRNDDAMNKTVKSYTAAGWTLDATYRPEAKG